MLGGGEFVLEGVKHTSDPYVIYITYFWPLHLMCCTVVTPVYFILHTLDFCNLYVTHPWPLHFLHHILLTPVLCVLHITDPYTLCVTYPDSCMLCVTYSRPLHFVRYILLTPTCCTLHTPNLWLLYLTYSWPLPSVHWVVHYVHLTPSLYMIYYITYFIICRYKDSGIRGLGSI